jgi:hypothetical protein
MINQKLVEELHAKCIVREGGSRIYPELFAELIVRECAKVIEDHYEPSYDGKILLQHFGVE